MELRVNATIFTHIDEGVRKLSEEWSMLRGYKCRFRKFPYEEKRRQLAYDRQMGVRDFRGIGKGLVDLHDAGFDVVVIDCGMSMKAEDGSSGIAGFFGFHELEGHIRESWLR